MFYGRGNHSKWVMPDDRRLLLKAQMRMGWSTRTHEEEEERRALLENKPRVLKKILPSEQSTICNLINKVESVNEREKRRVGHLKARLEKIEASAQGNGTTNCYICSTKFAYFPIFKSYPAVCQKCGKKICSRDCGQTVPGEGNEPRRYICKVCNEREEFWKKSNAWFFNAVPEYIQPTEREISDMFTSSDGWIHAKPKAGYSDEAFRGRFSSTGKRDVRIPPRWINEKVNTSMSESGVSGDGTPPSEDSRIPEVLEATHIYDSSVTDVMQQEVSDSKQNDVFPEKDETLISEAKSIDSGGNRFQVAQSDVLVNVQVDNGGMSTLSQEVEANDATVADVSINNNKNDLDIFSSVATDSENLKYYSSSEPCTSGIRPTGLSDKRNTLPLKNSVTSDFISVPTSSTSELPVKLPLRNAESSPIQHSSFKDDEKILPDYENAVKIDEIVDFRK
uniref:FYVE-type domain-containing protein n=1 Tax=Syphacia muris TaxID=451379 RepID=A0A0N5AA49_9BILA